MDWSAMEASGFDSPHILCEQFAFVDWIWDVCVVNENCSQLAIGTAHNSVVIWDLQDNKPLRYHYGKERCILYSLSFLNLHGELLVASGTVFTQVHIWNVTNPAQTHVCKAHKGVIFKLRWSEDGRYLLSVSDDRALIVWRNSLSTAPWSAILETTTVNMLLEGTYEPCIHAFGHTARLWDCIFTDDCLITTSEDCTVRFWDASGHCLATMGGHKGKHVWCVAYHPSSALAVSGGNDGSVKLWDVPGILATARSASTITLTIPSMLPSSSSSSSSTATATPIDPSANQMPDQVTPNPSTHRTAPRTSKSECIRDLSMTADGTGVIVASNWGYLWRYDLNRGSWEDLRIPADHESVSTIALSPENDIVAQGDCHGILRILSVHERFPMQQVHAIDKRISRIYFAESLLFVVAADNTIVVFSFDRSTGFLEELGQVKPETKGTVTTLLYLHQEAVLCIGDSVGIVHLLRFDHFSSSSSSTSSSSSSPLKVLARTILRRPTGHPTIGCLALHEGRLYAASHDGKIAPYTVDWTSLQTTAEAVLVAPTVKQILSLWWSSQGACCIGGYHESTYYVVDLTHNTEVLSVPAGGWKRPSTTYHHPVHPANGFVLAFAAPAGHSDVTIFRRISCGTRTIPPALIAPTHGRELNAICWITVNEEGGLVATGGEDREVQVIEVRRKDGQFTWRVVHILHGHSSCVRVLRSIALPDRQGYLLLSCGGRNEVCIWKLSVDGSQCMMVARLPNSSSKAMEFPREQTMHGGEESGKSSPSRKRSSPEISNHPPPTTTTTTTTTTMETSTDYQEGTLQRVMCASLIALDSTTACLATGDSCGTVQAFVIDLHSLCLYTVLTVSAHTTPILSIDITNDHTILAGTAAGDIVGVPAGQWIEQVLSTHCNHPSPRMNAEDLSIDLSVHCMGVNGLQLVACNEGASLCMTVGDDQSFRVSHYQHTNGVLQCERREVYEGVSGTALRSIASVPSGVYLTGWEQRVQRWVIEKESGQYAMAGEITTLVPETACIDVMEWKQHVLLAACGAMGFEVIEISL